MAKAFDYLATVPVKGSAYQIEIPHRATMKEVLQAVDEWAVQEGNAAEANKMWRVLTALRGPDTGQGVGSVIKSRTTAVIRRHSVPKLTTLVMADIAPATALVNLRQLDEGPGWEKTTGHFAAHIREAVEALDIEDKTLPAQEVVTEIERVLGAYAGSLTKRQKDAIDQALKVFREVKAV